MIKRLKRKYSSVNLIFYDIETITIGDRLEFRLGVVTCENFSFVCYDKDTMTNIIIKLCDYRKQNFIVAHNAQFDFALLNHAVFRELVYTSNFVEFDLLKFSMSPFFIHYRLRDRSKHATNLVFIDSMSFFKSSLDELGKVFGEPKQIVDVLRDRFDTEIEQYCIQDTKVLAKIMNFINEQCIKFDVRFPITFAQLSFNIFKKHFLKSTIYNPDIEDILRIERDSYFGGRVEAFNFQKHEKVKIYDINSLYPFVMENNYFPIRVRSYYSKNVCEMNKDKVLKLLSRLLDNNRLVIARVIVSISDHYIAPIPKRYDDKLIFPSGCFETVLCSPELELVRYNILEVKELVVYDKKRIFANFVTTMYNARMKYDVEHPLNLFFKLIMNSLYGKFAQRRFVFQRLPEYDDILQFGRTDLRKDDEFISLDYFDGKAFHRDIDDINSKSFVAISAFVTSYARVYLYNYMVENADHLIYTDTDSMILNNDLQDLGKSLGDWKEEKILTNFQVLGNKHYQSSELRKVKGVPSFARVLDDYNFEFDKITKIRESIIRFNSPQPRLVRMRKTYSDKYTKRIVLLDLTTKTLVLSEFPLTSFSQVYL